MTCGVPAARAPFPQRSFRLCLTMASDASRTILTTVGISLLGNAARAAELARGKSPSQAQIDGFMSSSDPAEVSAEMNALHRLLNGPDEDRLVFFCSETDDGRRCAGALARHYRNAGYAAEARAVSGLTYEDRAFKERGLRGLIEALIEATDVAHEDGRDVAINATGGFKAEIAFATLVGLLTGAPVYYIHEEFRELVEMPAVPVAWDFGLMAEHEDFFDWIFAEGPPVSDVEAHLNGKPDAEALRAFLTYEEGTARLSPVGDAFYITYDRERAEAAETEIFLSGRAAHTYENEVGHRSTFDRLLDKLRRGQMRRDQSNRLEGAGGYVYPRGDTPERVFYDAQGNSVYVCELFSNHGDSYADDYHRLRREGVAAKDYGDFQPWEAVSA